jgi:hypothetical protein
VNHSSAKSDARVGTLPWFPLLQRLHQIRNPRPRRRTAIQQFMSDYATDVNAALLTRCPDPSALSAAQKLNMRYDVAKTLLSSEKYSHLTEELDAKAVAQHDIDATEWSLALEDISSAKDVSRCVSLSVNFDSSNLCACMFRARDTLFDAVHPLLQAIGTYAGCYVSLIAGSPAKDDSSDGFFTA